MDLNIIRLVITLEPQGYAQLQSALLEGRGAVFENALRRSCCVRPVVNCSVCNNNTVCPAFMLTARELATDPELVRRHQKPGLPYVFLRHQTSIALHLFGPACQYIDEMVMAVDRVAGMKAIRSLMAVDYQENLVPLGHNRLIYADRLPILSAAELLNQFSEKHLNTTDLNITLYSSLCLVRNGQTLNSFNPAHFIRSLLRRLSSLAAYYGLFDDADRFISLSGLADEITVLSKQPVKQQLPVVAQRGIMGSYGLSGKSLSVLGPYIRLGSLLNLGKGAAYGRGQYMVTAIS